MRRGLAGVEAAAAVAPPNVAEPRAVVPRVPAQPDGAPGTLGQTPAATGTTHDPSRLPRQRRAPDSPAQQRLAWCPASLPGQGRAGSPRSSRRGRLLRTSRSRQRRCSGNIPDHGSMQCFASTGLGVAPKPSPDSALPPRRMCRLRRSGYLPAPVTESGDHFNASAERGDVGAHDVDAGDLAVFDLGDAGLGHAEGLG